MLIITLAPYGSPRNLYFCMGIFFLVNQNFSGIYLRYTQLKFCYRLKLFKFIFLKSKNMYIGLRCMYYSYQLHQYSETQLLQRG
jgi:hypothetical protein